MAAPARGQQQQGQSDLSGNQNVVHALASNAADHLLRAGLHHLRNFRAAELQAGDSPKKTPVNIARATLKHSTGKLIRMAASCGKENSGSKVTMNATAR